MSTPLHFQLWKLIVHNVPERENPFGVVAARERWVPWAAKVLGTSPLAKTSRPAVEMESVPAAARSIPPDRRCLRACERGSLLAPSLSLTGIYSDESDACA